MSDSSEESSETKPDVKLFLRPPPDDDNDLEQLFRNLFQRAFSYLVLTERGKGQIHEKLLFIIRKCLYIYRDPFSTNSFSTHESRKLANYFIVTMNAIFDFNFVDTEEYLYWMSEMIAMYTSFELFAATDRLEPEACIANRIAVVFKKHLLKINNDEEKANVLSMFARIPNMHKQRDIMSPIFWDFFSPPQVILQKELADRFYIQHLIVFYMWKELETDLAERERIIDFADKYMRPADSLWSNELYASYLPKTGEVSITKEILTQNYQLFNDLKLASAKDTRQQVEDCDVEDDAYQFGPEVNAIETGPVLPNFLELYNDVKISTFEKPCKVEPGGVLPTIDLTVGEDLEVKWCKKLRQIALDLIAAPPVDTYLRRPELQSNSLEQQSEVIVSDSDSDGSEYTGEFEPNMRTYAKQTESPTKPSQQSREHHSSPVDTVGSSSPISPLPLCTDNIFTCYWSSNEEDDILSPVQDTPTMSLIGDGENTSVGSFDGPSCSSRQQVMDRTMRVQFAETLGKTQPYCSGPIHSIFKKSTPAVTNAVSPLVNYSSPTPSASGNSDLVREHLGGFSDVFSTYVKDEEENGNNMLPACSALISSARSLKIHSTLEDALEQSVHQRSASVSGKKSVVGCDIGGTDGEEKIRKQSTDRSEMKKTASQPPALNDVQNSILPLAALPGSSQQSVTLVNWQNYKEVLKRARSNFRSSLVPTPPLTRVNKPTNANAMRTLTTDDGALTDDADIRNQASDVRSPDAKPFYNLRSQIKLRRNTTSLGDSGDVKHSNCSTNSKASATSSQQSNHNADIRNQASNVRSQAAKPFYNLRSQIKLRRNTTSLGDSGDVKHSNSSTNSKASPTSSQQSNNNADIRNQASNVRSQAAKPFYNLRSQIKLRRNTTCLDDSGFVEYNNNNGSNIEVQCSGNKRPSEQPCIPSAKRRKRVL